MTTIACRDRTMACDSCWASDDGYEWQTSEIKMFRLKSGGIIGFSGDGDARDVVKLFEHIKSERHLPSRAQLAETKCDCNGLFLMPNGKMWLIEVSQHGDRERWSADVSPLNRFGFAAIGTGNHFALGAMRAGKSAFDAVKIACDFCMHSKLPVHRMSLDQPIGNRRRRGSGKRARK